MSHGRNGTVQFGPFCLDGRTLRRGNKECQLSPLPAELLKLLISRAGATVLREDIRKELWPDETNSRPDSIDDRIRQHISTLRDVLGDDPHPPRFIETVPGGYRFIALIERSLKEDMPGSDESSPSLPSAKDVPSSEHYNTALESRRWSSSFALAAVFLVWIACSLVSTVAHRTYWCPETAAEFAMFKRTARQTADAVTVGRTTIGDVLATPALTAVLIPPQTRHALALPSEKHERWLGNLLREVSARGDGFVDGLFLYRYFDYTLYWDKGLIRPLVLTASFFFLLTLTSFVRDVRHRTGVIGDPAGFYTAIARFLSPKAQVLLTFLALVLATGLRGLHFQGNGECLAWSVVEGYTHVERFVTDSLMIYSMMMAVVLIPCALMNFSKLGGKPDFSRSHDLFGLRLLLQLLVAGAILLLSIGAMISVQSIQNRGWLEERVAFHQMALALFGLGAVFIGIASNAFASSYDGSRRSVWKEWRREFDALSRRQDLSNVEFCLKSTLDAQLRTLQSATFTRVLFAVVIRMGPMIVLTVLIFGWMLLAFS